MLLACARGCEGDGVIRVWEIRCVVRVCVGSGVWVEILWCLGGRVRDSMRVCYDVRVLGRSVATALGS